MLSSLGKVHTSARRVRKREGQESVSVVTSPVASGTGQCAVPTRLPAWVETRV
jgi:hypothetical protein